MAPTTCRGRSSVTALRRRAPGVADIAIPPVDPRRGTGAGVVLLGDSAKFCRIFCADSCKLARNGASIRPCFAKLQRSLMKEKLYVGPKVRLLREQSALTLEACAERLGMSASYLSQIETNQRPVTARVLIALARVFSLDPAEFDVDEEDRLIADLKEASADLLLGAAAPGFTELKLAAATTPCPRPPVPAATSRLSGTRTTPAHGGRHAGVGTGRRERRHPALRGGARFLPLSRQLRS